MNARSKPNGQGALLAKGSGANGHTISLSELDRAASVDASELSVANAAASSVVAGAEREAHAEVARSGGKGKRPGSAPAASQSHGRNGAEEQGSVSPAKKAKRKIPPGTEALPVDGEAFVDAVHSRVDLVLLEEKLLNSKDEKVAQRELAYLRELRYGKRAPSGDDGPQQLIDDIPRPEEDNTP